jgi:hypothetical protein
LGERATGFFICIFWEGLGFFTIQIVYAEIYAQVGDGVFYPFGKKE